MNWIKNHKLISGLIAAAVIILIVIIIAALVFQGGNDGSGDYVTSEQLKKATSELNDRIDGVEKSFGQKVDELGKTLGEKIDALNPQATAASAPSVSTSGTAPAVTTAVPYGQLTLGQKAWEKVTITKQTASTTITITVIDPPSVKLEEVTQQCKLWEAYALPLIGLGEEKFNGGPSARMDKDGNYVITMDLHPQNMSFTPGIISAGYPKLNPDRKMVTITDVVFSTSPHKETVILQLVKIVYPDFIPGHMDINGDTVSISAQ